MSRKGTPIDDSPMENCHALLKKETLYNNNITSLQEYIQLVEDWILFYNTNRIKGKKRQKSVNPFLKCHHIINRNVTINNI